MLKNLHIESFVIIDYIDIQLSEKMNVLTGETGAGKSIIVDAIKQLLGDRSSQQLIQIDKEKAVIEGIFDIPDTLELRDIFNEINIPFDQEVIVTKEIYSNGKSNIKINYKSSTNRALKILAPYLMHIHSQFDTHEMFEKQNHLHLLDLYIDKDLHEVKESYENVYKDYQRLKRELKKIEEEDFSDEMIEFYQRQYDELKDLEYTDEDIDEMEKELLYMKNYEKMNASLSQYNNEMNHVFDAFQNSLSYLDDVSDLEDFKEYYDNLYNHYYLINDLHDDINNAFSKYSFDEYRFNELQEELFKINALKKKYGYTMTDIYESRDELEQKIHISQQREDILLNLRTQINEKLVILKEKGEALHSIRTKYAFQFEKELKQQLEDLYLPNASLKIHFQKKEPDIHGLYTTEFLVKMNKGQNYTTLNETASGGEISRLMLGVLVIIFEKLHIDSLIFDEIDTGVSGKVADSIGKKMSYLSKSHQVICITHLPQVAIHADEHYAIIKEDVDETTISNLMILDKKQRIEEIAKMLSGNFVTDEAIKNAERLLQQS